MIYKSSPLHNEGIVGLLIVAFKPVNKYDWEEYLNYVKTKWNFTITLQVLKLFTQNNW